jgi:hypothetical protein
MRLFRKENQEAAPVGKPKTVIAAAVSLNEAPQGWKARQGEDVWQKDAWYFYDAVGELRFASNWLANAVSLANMYVAEVDPETGLITGPTENPQAQQILKSIFGGAAKRSQAQATMALNWQIAGEVFILIRSRRGQDDEWLVLSSTEVSERAGKFTYSDPITGAKIEMNPQTDLLLRLWSPHPRYQSHADSPVRAALPVLKEIERTSMNIASRLDSRLSGAGVWIIPKEMDFPGGDDTPEGPQGVMDLLMRAASASLTNPGQASAQVPIVVEAPGDQVANFSYQTFATELTAEVLELRPAAIKRLATTLDMPSEIIEGMGGSNHWSAWQIEEGGFKIHIAPLLDRFSDALTVQYLQLALAAAGVANPEKYVIAFDTTAIRTRPNRQTELLELHDRGLVSDEAVRSEAGIPDDDIPSDEEYDRRFVEKLVLQDTSLLADSGVRKILGLEELSYSEGTAAQSTVQQPELEESTVGQLPERASQSEESSQDSVGLAASAELMVWDALSRAGGRLLTREYRGQLGHVAKHELHTVIKGSPGAVLEGSFQFVDAVAPAFNADPVTLTRKLKAYCSYLIEEQLVHDRETMKAWLNL